MSSADLNVRFVPEADIEVLCIAEPMGCSTRVAQLNLARHISGLLVAAEKLFSFLQSGYFSLADVACSSAVVLSLVRSLTN